MVALKNTLNWNWDNISPLIHSKYLILSTMATTRLVSSLCYSVNESNLRNGHFKMSDAWWVLPPSLLYYNGFVVFAKKFLLFCTHVHAQCHIHFLVVFHLGLLPPRSSSTQGPLPPKVIFHQRLSSNKGLLPPKVVFHWRTSSTKGCLSPKVIFHWRLSLTLFRADLWDDNSGGGQKHMRYQ